MELSRIDIEQNRSPVRVLFGKDAVAIIAKHLDLTYIQTAIFVYKERNCIFLLIHTIFCVEKNLEPGLNDLLNVSP